MERESFEDSEVAEVLNKNYVSIKVDREERPDIDHIYMTVCHAFTGQGGWPLTIIMTPDKKPFYAGTYFPKLDRMGMPGILTILNKVSEVWKTGRDKLIESGEEIADVLNQPDDTIESINPEEILKKAFSDLKNDFDSTFGGFGRAPKFPTPHNLYFLLRYWYAYNEDFALEMVEKTLDSMNRGGIFDHIGYGFSRYSTDRRWLVPHFEKMLYDNALLTIAYLEAYQATKNEKYANTANQILTYVLRDMTSPHGGFYSAEDADSEGMEGKFYIWTPDEIKQVLGDEDGELFCNYYDVSSDGNFEGYNIPNLIKSASKSPVSQNEGKFIEMCREKLFEYRENRIHPYKDDKILTGWNGLMIAAMAIAGRILNKSEYAQAAEKALAFVLSKLVRQDGRLLARYRDGESAFPAYVDDYAFLVWGLIELYETTYKPEYLIQALEFSDNMLKYFWDEQNGGFFIYGNDSEQLISRPKEVYDGATPSGNSVATLNFLRLARLTGKNELENIALKQFITFGQNLEQAPRGYTYMLTALLYARSKSREIVLVSGTDREDTDKMIFAVNEGFMPFAISALYSDENDRIKDVIPFIENYKPVEGKTTAYVCENFACSYPVTNLNEFKELLS